MVKSAKKKIAKKTVTRAVKKKKYVFEEAKYYVYLVYESDSSGGGVAQGEEDSEWPCYEDEYNTFTPKGLVLESPSWSEEIKVDFDPNGSDHLYIVVVRYGSGSTFGRTHGHWHIEGAFKTYKEAQKIESTIRNGTGKYKTGKGHWHPWEGYFERFEGVSVERMDVWN